MPPMRKGCIRATLSFRSMRARRHRRSGIFPACRSAGSGSRRRRRASRVRSTTVSAVGAAVCGQGQHRSRRRTDERRLPRLHLQSRAKRHGRRAVAGAGAIVIGKTNLDQFATGLVGVRTPFPVPRNPFDAGRVPGGSSSGSAVAVAQGLATFSLGTDTAGSGRIPAAFNNLVGLKPPGRPFHPRRRTRVPYPGLRLDLRARR